MDVLLTGAGGMLGRYILDNLVTESAPDKKTGVATLGLRPESDYCVDLCRDTPNFGNRSFDCVIHCAGNEDDSNAMELNLEGTKRLCHALEKNPPAYMVYISSYLVYSRDAGENITEEKQRWATTTAGRSKALAEDFLTGWCAGNNVKLTILRPARMFGEGVHGETLRLFNQAISGRYIHIRGNDALTSTVTAADVARCAIILYPAGGVYNVSDGRNVKFIDMIESMTGNTGAPRRMTRLPRKWADVIHRFLFFIPLVSEQLDPQVIGNRSKSLTLDNSACREATGIEFFDTLKVISHRDKDYPYICRARKESANHIKP